MTARAPKPDAISACIVIPVYNHERAIVDTLANVLPFSVPVILVNDGSNGDCSAVLERLADEHLGVHLMVLDVNQGKGAAVKAGLKRALELGYSHALQVDADGQHNLADIPTFLSAAAESPNMIICGVPEYDDSVPRLRHYARYLTHVWVWINTLSFAIKDSMCGFRVYPLAAICQQLAKSDTGNRMDFDTEILVHWLWAGGNIQNFSTKVHYPVDGVSHFLPGKDNWLISCMHARLFFGMLVRAPLWLVGLRKRGRAQ
ncbi:glycosyltransferase family 2 protein [Simiduia litorea]